MNESYDVVVAGGGAAGLADAVALARSCRSVLVDAGEARDARPATCTTSSPATARHHRRSTQSARGDSEVRRSRRDWTGHRAELGRRAFRSPHRWPRRDRAAAVFIALTSTDSRITRIWSLPVHEACVTDRDCSTGTVSRAA